MVMCFAPDCKHYSERDPCRFFVFPKDLKEKNKWISLLRRQDRQPSKYSLVCSCHFKDGNRINRPTIFEHNKSKQFITALAISKEKKIKKQLQVEVSDLSMPSTSYESSTVLNTSRLEPTKQLQVEVPDLSMPSTSYESSTTLNTARLEPSPSPSVLEIEEIECNSSSSRDTSNFSFVATVGAENYFLKKELQEAHEKIKKLCSAFSFSHIENSDEKIAIHTGLPSNEVYKTLYELMDSLSLSYYHRWTVVNIPKIDQMLLTLMKLKLNLLNEDLAIRFNISTKTVSNIFYTWLYAFHKVLFKTFMEKIPSRNKNKLCMPTCFNNFTNCRIILDCTEIYCAQPKNMKKQKLTYSSYKHRNTLKGLIGVAPNGVVTYSSKLYPGSVSDKKIVKHCGILNQLEAGDLVLADKGFLISELLPPGVNLNIPPFLTTSQFTPSQVVQTRTIAKARIHVERAIRRIKCYKILSLMPASLIPHSSIIFQVCAALTNLQYPLIREVENLFGETDE